MTFGPHLMGDLMGCDPELIRDGEYVYTFLNELVDYIGMDRIGSPHLDLYSGPHHEWDGWSATVHIQTSHITMHAFAFGYVFIDIFSCRPFDELAAKFFIEHRLGAGRDSYWRTTRRGKNFPVELVDGNHA